MGPGVGVTTAVETGATTSVGDGGDGTPHPASTSSAPSIHTRRILKVLHHTHVRQLEGHIVVVLVAEAEALVDVEGGL